MENAKQPLLSSRSENEENYQQQQDNILVTEENCFILPKDTGPIKDVEDFLRECVGELKRLWKLAFPAIFTSLCQYTVSAITLIFAGQLAPIQLAAMSVVNSVLGQFSNGIMYGMASALETLCGQAFGAGQMDMLGLQMQKSWIILNATALAISFFYIFAEPILKLLGQSADISKTAGTLAVWMVPQIFASAITLPLGKFLQSQSKVMVLALVALVALVLHTFFSWLLMLKLRWGLAGAAAVLNVTAWFTAAAEFVYVVAGGSCRGAWSGFSWKAFSNLLGFIRLSVASALMLCTDMWFITALTLCAGYLKNAEVSVDALSICINILTWTSMIAMGLSTSISVRVSNELGCGHPRAAKLAVAVVLTNAFIIGLFLAFGLIISRTQYPALFSSSPEVQQLVEELTPWLGISIVVNNVQYVLSGVATGAGWQAVVAYMNIGSYFVLGVPSGFLMGKNFGMGVKGIWLGMLSGVSMQAFLVFSMICKANWDNEASVAIDRIKQLGSETDAKAKDVEKIDEQC